MHVTRGILFSILMYGPLSWGAVVYLDINNNPQERGAYEQAMGLARLKEAFIPIPQQDKQNSLRLKHLTRKRDGIFVQYVKKGCQAEIACTPVLKGDCGDLYARLKDSERRVAEIPKVLFNVDTLRDGLARLNLGPDDNIELSISGHFAVGEFTGNLGSISVTQIQSVFEQFPDLRRRVTQLHLLGCYTNTLALAEILWRKAFPQARVLVGFFGRSPDGSDPENLAFIHDIVPRIRDFPQVKTDEQFTQVSRFLERYKKLDPALAIDDFYRVAGGPNLRLTQTSSQSGRCQNVLPPQFLDFYRMVMSGQVEVPRDTGNSDLRTYYTALLQNADCLEDPNFKAQQGEVPASDQVVRLIFYRNVLKNFNDRHRADLANFDTYLQSIGVPTELSLARVNMSDRRTLIQWRDQVRGFLESMTNREHSSHALQVLKNFSDVIVDLQPYCVPTDFIEPGAVQRSVCFQVPGMCS